MRWVPLLLLTLACGQAGQELARGVPVHQLAPMVFHDGFLYFSIENDGGTNHAPPSLVRLDSATGRIETLADQVPRPRSIVVDDQFVYWNDEVSMKVLALDGGTLPRAMSPNLIDEGIVGLGLSGGNGLFWITSVGISRSSYITRGDPTDPSVANTFIAGFQAVAQGFATDADNLYWVDLHSAYSRGNQDSSGAPITTLATRDGDLMSVLVDGSQLYWNERETSGLYPGALMAVPLGGGSPLRLAETSGSRSAQGQDADYLYWREASCILRVPKHGGPVEAVASELSNEYGFAVSADSIFWFQQGSVYRLLKSQIQPGPYSNDCLTTHN